MARRIVWSDPAVDDLEAAVEFIAKDSPSYAANLAQLAIDAAESLVSTIVYASLVALLVIGVVLTFKSYGRRESQAGLRPERSAAVQPFAAADVQRRTAVARG